MILSGTKNKRTGMHAKEVEIRRTHKPEEMGTDSEKPNESNKRSIKNKSKEFLPTIQIIEDNSDIRFQLAAELLLTSDLPIAEVAFRVGYPEPGNFSKVLPNFMDCLPVNIQKTKIEFSIPILSNKVTFWSFKLILMQQIDGIYTTY